SLSQELTELEGDSAAKERDVLDCISEISKKRNRLTEIETRLDGMGARATRLDQELDGTRAAAKQNEKSLGVESGLVLESKERLQKKKEEGKGAAERFRETTDEIKKVDLESAGLRETLSKKKGLLLSLEELKRKFEGFGEGVRAVMAHEEAGRLTGIRKLLVDVIRTAPEYERAIEAALGEKLSGVIVDDIESAVSAAEFLGNNKEGKGVFISLQGREEPPMPFNPGVDGFVGRASDLIENPDSGFQKVPFAVLGDVLVFTTAECALRFQKGNQGPWTTVTLDGIVVGPFGIVSGGQDGKTSASLLSKNREIRELREEVEKVQREIKELDNRKEGLSLSAKEFEECNKRVTFEIHELEVGCLNGEKELQRLNGDAERLKRKLETLNLEKEQLSEESGALFNESADAKAFLLSKETEQQDIGDALLKNREEVTQKRKDLDGLKEKMNASKVEIAELMAKRDFLASEKKRIAREKESGERRIERILKELGEGEEKIGVLKERISSKKEEIFELGKEREELEKDIDGSATETGEKRGDLRRLEEELRLVKGQLQEVQANLGEKKLKRSEIAMRVEHLEKRAREEYSIEPEALPAPVDGFDEAVSKSRLDYLRKELERYGDVNLTAISDFEKVEKRYAFLYAQEEDLVLSIRSLDETITKIDRTTGKLFSETFEIINENFKKMFRRLFGGGKAELVLVEDESGKDPGIDILVQPPGKKLKNIQLMSAGEKAMTAISILFSVFMVRPSPFCLLDEIDAPLDDANIGRFKEMLRELTSETQFVIITHNQKTMTFADRLYGVTMQEHGVSNVLSVDMSEGKRKEANVAPMEVSGVREVETLSV
ncbi:MAG: chromosome segregation protein SMC, partial [Nitrospinota bacterium]